MEVSDELIELAGYCQFCGRKLKYDGRRTRGLRDPKTGKYTDRYLKFTCPRNHWWSISAHSYAEYHDNEMHYHLPFMM